MATGRIPTTANSPLTAKGDLFTFSTGSAKLAVGNNGETLVADSSTTTGLAYREDYAAGKNKIINGDFYINQRAFTSSTASGYGLDRWSSVVADGTVTYSVQTFTVGAAPVTGYEGKNFARLVTTGQTLSTAQGRLFQAIEDVRTFADQTVTISFWAKAASGTPKMAIELNQDFGTGGSPSSAVANYAGQVTLTTSWVRYSLTLAIPSISGKTIGTTTPGGLFLQMWGSAGTSFNSRTGSLGIQSNTFDIWGVQVEDGSVATAFNTATGTLQGELAACQRYYFRIVPGNDGYIFGTSYNYNTTNGVAAIKYPVSMRIRPTALEQTGTASNYGIWQANTVVQNLSAVPTYDGATTTEIGIIAGTVTANLTAGTTTYLVAKTTTAYLGWSAEL